MAMKCKFEKIKNMTVWKLVKLKSPCRSHPVSSAEVSHVDVPAVGPCVPPEDDGEGVALDMLPRDMVELDVPPATLPYFEPLSFDLQWSILDVLLKVCLACF